MLEYILQGQAMMIPLMICSVLAIGVALDRAWAFYQYRKTDTRSLRSQRYVLTQVLANPVTRFPRQMASLNPGL